MFFSLQGFYLNEASSKSKTYSTFYSVLSSSLITSKQIEKAIKIKGQKTPRTKWLFSQFFHDFKRKDNLYIV